MGNANGYVGITKRQVAELIESADGETLCKLVVIMEARTLQREQAGEGIGLGWMSSHRVAGRRLCELAMADSIEPSKETREILELDLSGSAKEEMRAILRYYVKQLTRHFRNAACAANPGMRERIGMYFAGPQETRS